MPDALLKKTVRISKKSMVRMPDVVSISNQGKLVDVYFGANFDTAVVVPHDKVLSRDNLERIRILVESK